MAVHGENYWKGYKKLPTAATVLDTGIAMTTGGQPIVKEMRTSEEGGGQYMTYLRANSFYFATGGTANKAFGQKLLTFPKGFISVKMCRIRCVSQTAASTSATAGEMGLGTVIGSGANATIGAVGATSENFMEGQTISNHVASTDLTSQLIAHGVGYGTAGAAQTSAYDGSETAAPLYFNIASAWTGTGNVTISNLKIWVEWSFFGEAAG